MYQAEYCPKCNKKTLRETYPCVCQKTAHNSDYAKCADDIMKLFDVDYPDKSVIELTLKKHFA